MFSGCFYFVCFGFNYYYYYFDEMGEGKNELCTDMVRIVLTEYLGLIPHPLKKFHKKTF